MGNEASSPERTKKHAVFESPVIIPHPEKELDDGGVYKGGPASDRILKVSEILRRSLEMDIDENDDSSSDVILRNVTESDGDDPEPKSPTFRSSVTIHLSPCVKTLESTDRESTSKENTDMKTTVEQWPQNEERPDGESDQVKERVIDKTISNLSMSGETNGPPLCNGNTSGMSENSSTGVASEVEDEIVAVTKVTYYRGNSNIDDYIEKAKKIAPKANGYPTGAWHSPGNGALHNGIDKVNDEEIDVIQGGKIVDSTSEPVSHMEKEHEEVKENFISEELAVRAECLNEQEVSVKNPEINSDHKENEKAVLEDRILSEIIEKEEIQRQTSVEEQREKSKKKQSPLAKIGTKFNDALKTIKTKRRESMERSKHRVSGAYAAEQDISMKSASPTEEKIAPRWDNELNTKGNVSHPNGISYEGATQKAYAICSEYALVVRKPGSSSMIELSPEIKEHKESGSEFDTDSELDTDLIMKASAPETEAERQGPLYVGLIVKDAQAEAEKASLSDYAGSVEENTLQPHTVSVDDNSTDQTSSGIEESFIPDEIKPDVIEESPIPDEMKPDTDEGSEKVEGVTEIVPEEVNLNNTEAKAEFPEQPKNATVKSPTNTKVKKKNSILKYLLHTPKKSKKKDKHPQRLPDDDKSIHDNTDKSNDETTENHNTESSLMYVEYRDKEQHIVHDEATLDSAPKSDEKHSPDSSDAEFEEIDLKSTPATPAVVTVNGDECEEKCEELNVTPNETADSQTTCIEPVEDLVKIMPENVPDIQTESDSLDVNVKLNNESKEPETTEILDTSQSVIIDSGITDEQGDNTDVTKPEIKIDAEDLKSSACDVKDEIVSEKYNLDHGQAIVIDVTCVDDTVGENDNSTDSMNRQEKRKLPDEESDSFDLPIPTESPADGASTSISAKSSPTRKKKKKRVNSLSAKISDFFGVADFKRRISTSSSRSDKSPQDERNVWSPEEKNANRKESGSSTQERSAPEIEENAERAVEVEEEIKPQSSLQAKSMPILTVDYPDDANTEKSSKKEEVPKGKNRGKSKSKSPLKSSFLESFGLYTSKPKKRPVISSPMKQENRKSLFDEDINVDVDQDLHIISLSDDEGETDAKREVESETDRNKSEDFSKNDDKERKILENDVSEEIKAQKCPDEKHFATCAEERNSNGTSEKDNLGTVELDLPLASKTHEVIDHEKDQQMNPVMPVDKKISPGEYVSLKSTPESKTEKEGTTEYLKFEQESPEPFVKVDSKMLDLKVNDVDNQTDPESIKGDKNTLSNVDAEQEIVAGNEISEKCLNNATNCIEDKVAGDVGKEDTNKTMVSIEECETNAGNTTVKETANTDVELKVETDETAKEAPVRDDGSNSDEDSSNDSPSRTIVVATIESPPVSQEHDLCEMKDSPSSERCQDTSGDSLCNNAEYDSINMDEERTVSIENPNYCATCQVENKSPTDKVDDLHSKDHVDVNGENTDTSITVTSDSAEAKKSSNASARSASMEELTVHSSHVYEEIEKKKPIIYRRFSDKSENRKVICTSPDPEGKKVKKKKSRSSSFSEFFRNPTKYKMPAWRNKKSKEVI